VPALRARGIRRPRPSGGTLASGLSGPARPWRGSVRDAVLGIRLINGEGELLRFGGEVMKNVAGYDVSRLQSGALGTLGLITEVSLRLLPAAAQTLELERPCPADEALTSMRSTRAPPPAPDRRLLARGVLYLRFEGSAAALEAIDRELADYIHSTAPPWRELREWSLPELASDRRAVAF
jgi:glycolate oxidase FAD binding subunit